MQGFFCPEIDVMKQHTPKQQFNQALRMASDHGMKVVDKSPKKAGSYLFIVYRTTVPKWTLAGKCHSPAALFELVDSLVTAK